MRNYTTSLLATLALVACSGSNDSPLTSASNGINIVKAAYWDNWSSSIEIPNSTLKVLDIVLGAFGSWTSNSADSTMLGNFQQACTANPDIKLFLSVGGSNGGAPTLSQVPQYIANVMEQVTAYNKALVGCQVYGVDLDLENGTTADAISAFAAGFKAKGLQVSVAPQAYNTTGSANVSSANPTNFSLTSGGSYFGATTPYNQFGTAVASGNVDYIFLQTYNTGGWTIDSCDETMTCFISAVATTMANLVQPQSVCTIGRTAYAVCIPSSVKILITEPSNCNSASLSIFTSNCTASGQTASLSALNSAISVFPSQIKGVVTWDLAGSGDYAPSSSSTVGAFSSTIFGAPAY
jgi:chitinase